MKKMSGGQAAVASLQAENVQHVFGLIGSATMEMFDALCDATKINFLGIRSCNLAIPILMEEVSKFEE